MRDNLINIYDEIKINYPGVRSSTRARYTCPPRGRGDFISSTVRGTVARVTSSFLSLSKSTYVHSCIFSLCTQKPFHFSVVRIIGT